MKQALLAWECGGGRGHIVALKAVAQALHDKYIFDAALCRMDYAAELSPLCEAVYQGPRLGHKPERRLAAGNPRIATWGEYLGDLGFLDEGFLGPEIAWWQQLLRNRQVSLLVAAFAPCALIAARSLGVPSIAVGTGFFMPPADLQEFPILLPEHSRRIHDEAAMVAAVNRAGEPLGIKPIKYFPEIWASDVPLVCSLEILDPYARVRKGSYLPPIIGSNMPQIASGGDEVFVYFSGAEMANVALIEAIASLGLPTRVFFPGVDSAQAAALSARGVIVERAPVAADDIARRSRILVNAGQHGTLCLGLAAGLPQVAFPQHFEQIFNARAAQAAGVLVIPDAPWDNAAEIVTRIRAAYNDAQLFANTREFSHEIRALMQIDIKVRIREHVRAIVA